MSAPINTGGPAFPVNSPVDDTGRVAVGYPYPCEGMTLRDYFAASALPAIIAASCAGTHLPGGNECRGASEDRIAYDTYKIANAMLAARGDA